MRLVSARASHTETSVVRGIASIMRAAFHGDNLADLTDELIARIQANRCDSAALLDLSVVLQLNAQTELALELQAQALQQQQLYQLKSNPLRPAIRLLAIMGPGEIMANTPLEFLVEDSDVAVELLYLGEGLPAPAVIPQHDVAMVAVCESDQNQHLLCQLNEVMKHWPQPFINSPAAIAQLSRNSVSHNLAANTHLVASDAHRMLRDEVSDLHGCDCFPVIARPVNSHAGFGLEKISSTVELEHYMRTQDAAEFFVAPFIDYRSIDGWYRKYRIAVVQGRPFAAHMAISQKWMVHYLNADMLQNQKNRDEEADFMARFDDDFAVRHRKALAEVDRCVDLDYYSIDCAETTDGRLLVFEIDSGAVVHSMDSAEIFPYKGPQMKRVFEAFRQMLEQRAYSQRRVRAA